jgi:hypothetical protein
MKLLPAVCLMLFMPSIASAQVFLGDGNGTSGVGGSCCTWTAQINTGGACPADQVATHPACQVITTAQYSAYQTAVTALQPSTANNLLAAGVAITFTSTTTANDSYAATAAALQNLLNLQTGKVGIGAAATITVPGISGPHTMGQPAFHDVYNAVSAYHDAVLAAQATALTNNTAPVFPAATATSSH